MGALRHAASGLGWFGIFALLVLSPAIGSIASVAAVLTAVLLTPVAFTGDGWDELRRQPALLAMPAAFGVLVLLFAVTARHSGDVLFAANFFALLLAPTVYLLARHRAGARSVLVLSTLCALGTLVGALTASYDVFLQHKERAVGWASGGNLMARTVIPLGFLALAGMLVSSSRWRWLYLMAPVLALYTLYLTGTRGVFVAVPVLAVLIVLTVLDQRRSPWMAYVAAFGLAAAIVVVLVGRDLSSLDDLEGPARITYLASYNYARAWPLSLDFHGVFGAVTLVAALGAALFTLPRLRHHAVVLVVAVGVWAGAWALDVYLVRAAPHWGQRETILEYYRRRTGPEEPLVAFQMNWKGENFYSGNRVAAFVSTGEKFQKWLEKRRKSGTKRLYFVVEHGRVGALKSELGAGFRTTKLTDQSLNDKFALVRVDVITQQNGS